MSEFSLNRIDKGRYRPTAEAEGFLESLRRTLVPGEKFKAARLAFARSLLEPGEPALLVRGTEMGGAIEGTHLFGEETGVWACLFAEAASAPFDGLDSFRHAVEAHWHCGALLLQADLDSVEHREVDFAVLLAHRVHRRTSDGSTSAQGSVLTSRVKLVLRLGEVGMDHRTNTPVDVAVNAPGVSPHLAFMGKTRSGKTRTGLAMAERIVTEAKIPVIIIDPKGEFVREGEFVNKTEWGNRSLADRVPGLEVLDVPLAPIPLDFLALPRRMTQATIPQTAIGFRDSFQKCIRVKGDVAMDDLRELVEDLLTQRRGPVSLERIRDAVRDRNEQSARRKDTVQAKLNELTSLHLFEPTLAPADFFQRRWVIGLGGAKEESKRLVMFLVLDALASYLLSLEDSDTDRDGFRALRHLLVIDEAKEILAYRHGALSNLLRKSAAKGGIVMLLSQSPDDFDKEADDFLQQVGTICTFTSNAQSVKNLRAALGRRVDPEAFSDKELPKGVALVKLPHREATKVVAWK